MLKNNIFEHNGRTFMQKRGTAIGTKLAPPYAILFMDALEEDFLRNSQLKPFVWWRYIDDIFFDLATWGGFVERVSKLP